VWELLTPWSLVGNYSLGDSPNLSTFDVDPAYFKNYTYNIFNPCIAQNVGEDTDYLNCFCYVSPTRYQTGSASNDTEGILWFKIKKSDGSKSKVNYYNGHDQDNHYSFHHQKPRRDSDSCVYQPVVSGNYQAWEDDGNVHLYFVALREQTNFSTSCMAMLYNGNVSELNSSSCYSGGRGIFNRFIKWDDYVYRMYQWNGLASIKKDKM